MTAAEEPSEKPRARKILFWLIILEVVGVVAFILALLAGGAIFLFVRTHGEDRPGATS